MLVYKERKRESERGRKEKERDQIKVFLYCCLFSLNVLVSIIVYSLSVYRKITLPLKCIPIAYFLPLRNIFFCVKSYVVRERHDMGKNIDFFKGFKSNLK